MTVATRLTAVPLGGLVDDIQTWNPSRAEADRTFSYIDLGSVDESKMVSAPRTIRCADAPSRARQLVKENDVLVSTVRPNLNGVALVRRDLDGATASTGFCVLRPRVSLLDSRYLFQWVKSHSFVAEMTRRATGASYPAVSDAMVRESTIPLPPLPEQRRIAAILDKADELRARRRAALAQLNGLTKAMFLEMFGDPVENDHGWERRPFSDLLESIDSGWSPVCLDRPVIGDEWGVLKLGAVTWCEYDASENKALPPNVQAEPTLEVKPGDLLFARKNTYELVAACAFVQDTPPRLLMSDLIFRFRLRRDAEVDARFLQQLLIYPTKRRTVQQRAGGTAGSMPNISKSKLLELPIELPPLLLQRKFATRVRLAETLKTQHNRSSLMLDALFASLQHQAFAGEF